MFSTQVNRFGIQASVSVRARSDSVCAYATAKEIRDSIGASRARKASRAAEYLACPGCAQKRLSFSAWLKHVRQCCPDLIRNEQEWEQALHKRVQSHQLRELMEGANSLQVAAQAQVLQLAFAQKDDHGDPVKQRPEEFAPALGVTTARAERILKMAIKATPMPADPQPVCVLYEDEVLIAVSKPANVTSTPIHRHQGRSMVNRLIGYLGKPPHVLHRLDMDTTGVMLFAKEPHVVAAMHAQFRSRTVSKTYAAICLGAPSLNQSLSTSSGARDSVTENLTWDIDTPLGRHANIKTAGCISPTGKTACTHMLLREDNHTVAWPGCTLGEAWFQPAEQAMHGACLLECVPVTGRTHQIRLHCAASGHPIVGDTLYGISVAAIARHALHAWKLSFHHPINAECVNIVAPLPEDMKRLGATCGFHCIQ
eukprot:jgi/Ulvmu1/8952/UM005_0043.1